MPEGKLQPDAYPPPQHAMGVTLLELLVAIGVVAILTALVLTTLRGARSQAKTTAQMADLRSAAQTLHSWSAERDDYFLNVGTPESDDLAVYLSSPSGELLRIPYLQQKDAGVWKRVLEATSGEVTALRTTASYGFPCFTDPRLWTTDPQPWTQFPARKFLRLVRRSEAQYPSEKGVLITHVGEPNLADPTQHTFAVAFVDGSVGEYPASQFLPQTEGFFGGRPARYFQPVLHTIGGIGGRDVAR